MVSGITLARLHSTTMEFYISHSIILLRISVKLKKSCNYQDQPIPHMQDCYASTAFLTFLSILTTIGNEHL